MARTKIEKTWQRLEIERLCQRYSSTKDAAVAAGMTPGGFARVCRRLNILTPPERRASHTNDRPPLKRLCHLQRFLALYEAMGVRLVANWDPDARAFFVELSGKTKKMRGDAYAEVSFDRHGNFLSQLFGIPLEPEPPTKEFMENI